MAHFTGRRKDLVVFVARSGGIVRNKFVSTLARKDFPPIRNSEHVRFDAERLAFALPNLAHRRILFCDAKSLSTERWTNSGCSQPNLEFRNGNQRQSLRAPAIGQY
jgi:hypothetical protein